MSFILGGAVLVGTGILWARSNMDQMIYFPPHSSSYNKSQFRQEPVPHYCIGADATGTKILHVFYHGNATDAYLSMSAGVLGFSQDGQWSTGIGIHMYIEYPGYSLHPNKSVSTSGILKDVEKLAQWIREGDYRVNIIGQSIGTGPACYLAYLLRDSVLNLELITPFKNMCALAGEHVPFGSIFAPNCYPNDYYLSELTSDGGLSKDKIIIHHGTEDKIIPYSHAVELSNYGTLKTYKGATHNNLRWYRGFISVPGHESKSMS